MHVEPLRDECLIVRGGLMELRHLRKQIEDCKKAKDFYGLSMFGENDMTIEEIVVEARMSQWAYIRVSTMGRLRTAGFEPVRKFRWPHLSLIWDGFPSDNELKRLVGTFDEPVDNPHPLARR